MFMPSALTVFRADPSRTARSVEQATTLSD